MSCSQKTPPELINGDFQTQVKGWMSPGVSMGVRGVSRCHRGPVVTGVSGGAKGGGPGV